LERIFLSIAGFTICLIADEDSKIALDDGYFPFVIPGQSNDPDIIIRTKKGIPKELLNKKHLIFEAKNELRKYFSIYQHMESYKFIIYDQQVENKIQQIAILDREYTNWVIYTNPNEEDNNLYPLQYPLGPIVFYYFTVKLDAIMIHASGVFDGLKGRVFSGFSGTGKSTMAELWQKSGSLIINDDRLIIRKRNAGFEIHNTPMFYPDMPKMAPLHSINLIYHSKGNCIKKLSGTEAISRIMTCCIQHDYDKRIIEHQLSFISSITEQIPVYEVGFFPNEKIVDFITDYAG